jgi:ankyrin repeat protein
VTGVQTCALPIYKACANGHEAVVDILLLHHAKLNVGHSDGKTALHLAVEEGLRPIAEMLLRAGADASIADLRGTTPLHIAAARGDVAMVDLLLEHGAKRSKRDKRGVTPLMSAVGAGAIPTIRALIAAGAKIEETLDVLSDERLTESGARGGVMSMAARMVRSLNWRRSRLHECVVRNDFLGVRTEIEKGTDPNAVGPDGMTPLELAAAHGHLNMWGVLIDLGAGRRIAKS